jgi:predicted O-methyltransferase YrrM
MLNKLHTLFHLIRHYLTASRGGHGIHSPFAFQLCEEVFYNPAAFYDFKKLEKIREELLRNKTVLTTGNFGAGSKVFRGETRKVKDIARRGISSAQQSETLYRLINFLKTENCIELGTSLGLNALYLASANPKAKVHTVEGSKALFQFAAALAKKNQVSNIEFINSDFDTALPELLKQQQKTDLIYVDGNHSYEATMRYFRLALGYKHPNTVLVFDDIYWSPGMTKAWKEISKDPQVKMSIDLFYFGMVFFKEEIQEKVGFRMVV